MYGSLDKRQGARAQGATSEKLTALLSSRASVVATFKQRDQWARKVARDRRVKPGHRLVLEALALTARLDKDGKLVVDPTYDLLAKASACHRATAIRTVAVAEEIGILRKARHSDGRVANSFDLLLPIDVANGDKTVEKAPEKTQEIPRPTVANFAAPVRRS